MTPPVLRHTFAVTAVQKGVSPPALQRPLDHDRLTATEIYLNLSPEEVLREFREKCSKSWWSCHHETIMSEHRSEQGSSKHRAKPSNERLHGHLRVVLWSVDDRRCAYTGERISGMEHVVIDQVFLKRLAHDDDERQEALATFDLPPDFQIRGNLGNVVPTTHAFNALNLDKTQPDEMVPRYAPPYVRHRPYEDRQNVHAWPVQTLIACGLGFAQQNRAAVERMQQRVDMAEKLLALKHQMPSGLRTQDSRYDLLSDEELEFSVRNECDETHGLLRHVLFSSPGVYLRDCAK